MTEETIFVEALEKQSPAELLAFLDETCGGDADLRRRVEGLLKAHRDAGGFLEGPALGDETRAEPPAAEPDDDLDFLRPSTKPGSLGRLGHYEVLEVLGRGGFGIVLRAFDERLHRVVAIKVLAPQLATSGTARRRFVREARSAAAVRDEHVVNIHGVSGDDDPVAHLVMEFVSGQTLQQKLDRGGPLPVTEVLRIGQQIARGLAAAHATGLIHRDIKPANILLENGVERVKITDFGLARTADDASLSQSGLVAGTPLYMAPEQALGEHVDHRADLFSLGSVLYAMCTGRPPFRASTTMAVLRRVCDDEPRPVRELNPEVPPWLAEVIARLHAKNPDHRFQSAGEVADLLAQSLAGAQVHGVVAPLPPPPARPRRLRVAIMVGVLALVSLSGVGVYALTRPGADGGTPSDQTHPAAAPAPYQSPRWPKLQPKDTFFTSGVEVRQGVILPGTSTLVTAHPDKMMAALTDLEKGECKELIAAGDRVWSVSVTPAAFKDRRVVAAGTFMQVCLHDLTAGKNLPPLGGDRSLSSPVEFVLDGTLLAAGGARGPISVWEWQAGKLERELIGHTDGIAFLRASPDGRRLASGSADGTARVWDMRGREKPLVLTTRGKVSCGEFSPDGKLLAVGEFCGGGVVRIFEVLTGQEVGQFTGHEGWLNGVAYSPTVPIVASAGAAGRIFLWDRDSHEVLAELPPEGDEFTYSLLFTPDGKTLIATSTRDKKAMIKVYDVSSVGRRPQAQETKP